jgi:hypothetical protein
MTSNAVAMSAHIIADQEVAANLQVRGNDRGLPCSHFSQERLRGKSCAHVDDV